MKIILFLLISLFSLNAFTSNYEVEFFFTADDRDTDSMQFTDLITLRQFKGKANWKDNKGGYGVVECMGNLDASLSSSARSITENFHVDER